VAGLTGTRAATSTERPRREGDTNNINTKKRQQEKQKKKKLFLEKLNLGQATPPVPFFLYF
jgi:hypothetical protein